MSDDNSANPKANPAAQGDGPPPLPGLPVLSYATPDGFRSEILRDGRYIVLPHGMDLPDRCIKCGKPADVRLPVSISLVVPLRNLKFNIGMCRRHFRQYRLPRLVLGDVFEAAGIVLGVVMFAEWLSEQHATGKDLLVGQIPGCVLLATSAAVHFTKSPHVWCHKANATASWIGGAKEPFLDQLSPIEPGRKSIFNRDISEIL